jgi:hypothetical protein
LFLTDLCRPCFEHFIDRDPPEPICPSKAIVSKRSKFDALTSHGSQHPSLFANGCTLFFDNGVQYPLKIAI